MATLHTDFNWDCVPLGDADCERGTFQWDLDLLGAQYVEALPEKLPAVWMVDGIDQGGEFGYAVAGAGDVNADGYADVILGGARVEKTVYREGTVQVYFGGAGGLSPTASWEVGSGQTGSRFGHSVSGAGDVNKDGFDDILVGANRYNHDQPEEGAVFLYLSSSWGLPLVPSWSFESDQVGAQLGASVAGAGDVNKDGYDDVLVGAPLYDAGELNEGCVFLFFGSEEGLADDPDWTFCSDETAAELGAAVAGVGDLNQDGCADIAIGAPTSDRIEEDAGEVYVFLGSEDGPVPLAGQPLLGTMEDGWFGAAVGGGGDLNSDGFEDLVIGAPNTSSSENTEGAVYVYPGNADGIGAAPIWTMYGGQESARFGSAVGAAGDFDGDGVDDLLIGARQASDDQSQEGLVYVYRGSSAGVAASPTWFASGDKSETGFGATAAGVGDVDKDNRPEILVGAPDYRIQTDIMGRAFLFEGQGVSSYPHRIYLPQIVLGTR